jgi:hypothetical protein
MDIKTAPLRKRAKARRFLRDAKLVQAQVAGDIRWMTAAFAQRDKTTIVRWVMTRYLCGMQPLQCGHKPKGILEELVEGRLPQELVLMVMG